jgi:hypothetical protein
MDGCSSIAIIVECSSGETVLSWLALRGLESWRIISRRSKPTTKNHIIGMRKGGSILLILHRKKVIAMTILERLSIACEE